MKGVEDFANVVYSVILYGAPFWGGIFLTSRARYVWRRIERSVAQRVVSAYRTVFSNAALLLARLPPLRLLAPTRKRIYERCKEYKDRREYTVRVKNTIKEEEFSRLYGLWRFELEKPNTPGEYTKLAILPQMDAWLVHDSGSMSFHITQLMTGHGCFNRFLWRIGKRDSADCNFCGAGEDDATHTLKFCGMWDAQRELLREKLGLNVDFSLSDIVDVIIVAKEAWTAFSAFAEDVMSKKEEEERRREMVRDPPLSLLFPPIMDDGSGSENADTCRLYQYIRYLIIHSSTHYSFHSYPLICPVFHLFYLLLLVSLE